MNNVHTVLEWKPGVDYYFYRHYVEPELDQQWTKAKYNDLRPIGNVNDF